MPDQIEVILFDMGGTLRTTIPKSKAEKIEAVRRMIDLLDARTSVEDFLRLLSARARAYKQWCEKTLIELSERELWTQWMLPDWPAEEIGEKAVLLNQMYREANGTREIFPETYAVIVELFQRGYRLGLVSNTTSSVEVPAELKEMRLTGCFEVVILSTVLGKRKPDPAILLNATSQMGIIPEKCAYVGDRVDRDVAAAQKAGFSKSIIMRDPAGSLNEQIDDPLLIPDHTIGNLDELLNIFPGCAPFQPWKVFNVSLSTMWSLKNFPTLSGFFEFARRAGFAGVELNHKINSAMLSEIDLHNYSISSLHEPCPADIPTDTLKKEDWLPSSLVEEDRRKGVKAIQRTIDLAHQLGVPVIVVHVGHTQFDKLFEKQLHVLYHAGKKNSDEYREIQRQMVKSRMELAAPGLESVKKSVLELVSYANQFGIRIGLENRYHFMEYPNPDEIAILEAWQGQRN